MLTGLLAGGRTLLFLSFLCLLHEALQTSDSGPMLAPPHTKQQLASQCEQRGNWNPELETCECPLGWTGPACGTLVLGACRSSNSSTALPMYGTRWPKSCECWRQLLQ